MLDGWMDGFLFLNRSRYMNIENYDSCILCLSFKTEVLKLFVI